MGSHIKSLGEFQVDNVHHLPHINQASYFVIKGDHVCQAQVALGESMLALPNLVLFLTCDGPQEDVFRNFPRDRNKTDALKFPESFFNPFLQMGVILAFFQSSGASPNIHNHADYGEQPPSAVRQLSEHLQGTKSGPIDHWGPSPCHRSHTNSSFTDCGSVFASAWGFVPKA